MTLGISTILETLEQASCSRVVSCPKYNRLHVLFDVFVYILMVLYLFFGLFVCFTLGGMVLFCFLGFGEFAVVLGFYSLRKNLNVGE